MPVESLSLDETDDHAALAKRSVRGTVWTIFGNGLAQVLLLCAHILCARILGRTGYGKFGVITSTTATFGLLAGLGLSLTATKYVAEFRRTDPLRAKRILLLSERTTLISGGIMTLALLIFSKYLAQVAFGAPELRIPLEVSAITIFFTVWNTLQIAVLSAFEEFSQSSRLSIFRSLICVPTMVVGAYYGGVTGAAAGLLAGTAIGCIAGFRMVARCSRAHGLGDDAGDVWREKSIFWQYSIPALLGGVVTSLAAWALNIVLVRSASAFDGMGVLSASRQWLSALTFLPVAIGGGSIPVLSAASATFADKARLRQAFRVPDMLVQISIWPVTLVLLVMSPEILRAYGPNYQDGVPTFLWMIGGTAVGFMGYTCSLIVQSRGQMWFGLTHNVVYAIVSLAISIAFLSRIGVLAIALGTAGGQTALLIWMLVVLVFRYDFPADIARKVFEKSALMLGLVFVLSRTLTGIPFLFRASVAAFCIGGFIWKSWSVPELRALIGGRLPFLRNRFA